MSFWLAQRVSSHGDKLGGERAARSRPKRPKSLSTTPKGTGGRDVIDFVIRNRIHLLPAAALITWAAPPLYGSAPFWNALPSVLLAFLGIYELNRLSDGVEDEINDPGAYAKTLAAKTRVRTLTIAALSASIVLSMILTNYAATIALSAMLFAGVLYSGPFLAGKRGRLRLKQIPALKNVVPAIVWPCIAIIYPSMSGTGVHAPRLVLAVTALFWAVFTIEVAWDVRDARGDQIAGIHTLANTVGARRALLVPLLASCGEALVIVALIYRGSLAALWLLPALFLVLLPTIAYLWRDPHASDRDRSHLLILLNTLALILLGLAGRWEG